jgi:hypothetical protein
MGMFDKKPAAKKTTAKKDDKRLVAIAGAEFNQAMLDAATLDDQIKNLEAKRDAAKAVLKAEGKAEWVKIFEKEGINSGSFNMESDDGHSCMFLPTSKYGSMDEDTYNEYVETYGAENLDEDVTYKFNNGVLSRNQDAIEEAIMGAKGISDEDKKNLLDVSSKYSWKKDSLDKVAMLAKNSDNDVETVLEDLAPVHYPSRFKAAKA